MVECSGLGYGKGAARARIGDDPWDEALGDFCVARGGEFPGGEFLYHLRPTHQKVAQGASPRQGHCEATQLPQGPQMETHVAALWPAGHRPAYTATDQPADRSLDRRDL